MGNEVVDEGRLMLLLLRRAIERTGGKRSRIFLSVRLVPPPGAWFSDSPLGETAKSHGHEAEQRRTNYRTASEGQPTDWRYCRCRRWVVRRR